MWTHQDQGKLYLSVPENSMSFLLNTSLPMRLRDQTILVLIAAKREEVDWYVLNVMVSVCFDTRNTRFIASSTSKDERDSVNEAFAGAVLWAGDILAHENQLFLVDFHPSFSAIDAGCR